MNFFDHQDQARRNTRWLIVLFSLAVLSLITITTLLVAFFLYLVGLQQGSVSLHNDGVWRYLDWELAITIALAVLAVVAMASFYKLKQLSGGGETVAEALGGRRLQPNSQDLAERQLLNVVEEMAIASGTPVPPVFILEERGINAFAAGYSANDAVIGVTRGCMELLDREQLQGVIAHEFSHILHGDMRINIRLIGTLHGILILGLLGSILLRSSLYGRGMSMGSSRRNNNGGAALAILGLGLGLVVVGYAGTFFGKLIKSAVSRQREFLADASAVQFTRNPRGISGALQAIGGHSYGAQIRHSNAEEFNHMYFGEGTGSSLLGLLATHPPLATRIRRLDPQWDGDFPVPAAPQPAAASAGPEAVSGLQGGAAAVAAAAIPTDSIGNPSPRQLGRARQLLQQMPPPLTAAAREPFAARAIVYSLLIQPRSAEAQWQQLQQRAHPVVHRLTQQLQPQVAELPRDQWLPLFELSIPALKTLSEPQYQLFKENVVALIRADKQVDVFEWSLYRLLMNTLEPAANPARQNSDLRSLAVPCQQLLSTLASAGHSQITEAEAAYQRAMSQLKFANLPLLAGGQISLPMLDSALKQLRDLKPLQKPQLLKALVVCIQHDGQLQPQEYELLRAVADCLDCPMPPLVSPPA